MFDCSAMKKAVSIANEHWQHLHRIPEMAFGEYETTAYLREACGIYPVEIIDIGMETGLVCCLDAGCDRTVALRADIDAVPTENGPRHLCGHDGHAASLIGAMHFLSAALEDASISGIGLTHNVLFIFQPAEEGTRGARAMLDHGLLTKVPQRPECIFGIHNRPEVGCGDIVVHKGPLMSEKTVFTVTFTGRPGHGSLPHKCVDPIVAAASFIGGVQTIVSRNVDPFHPVICTVNSVAAGRPEVPAPESAVMTGYIRSFDHNTHMRMEERLRDLAEGTAQAYQCKCEAELIHMVPAVNNTEAMYERAMRAAVAAAGSDHIVDSAPCLASEDFAVFGTEIPSFLYWVGSGTPGRQNAPWHDPGFSMDPDYQETAVPLLCSSAINI